MWRQYIFWCCMMMVGMIFPAWGQNAMFIKQVEQIGLVTDRSIYVTGEWIHFSARVMSQASDNASTILYAELITPDGKQVSGGKFSILQASSTGCLFIPEDLITGIYYVRAYTKYMRNVGPEIYAYVQVRVINPKKSDVLAGSGLPLEVNKTIEKQDFTVTTILDKKEYTPGEQIRVELMMNSSSGYGAPQICVAVVPDFTARVEPPIKFSGEKEITTTDFYPETRAVSLTGQLRDGATGDPVAGARINLSIIGQGRDFEAVETDRDGHYYFSLPDYTGPRDVFLCAEKDSLMKPILLVDNDYCTLPVHLPAPEFILTPDEQSAALLLARQVQIARHFFPDSMKCQEQEEISPVAFYGQPSDVLVLDDYIQLPTLEDYFNELPSAVRVRKQNGHKYFKVLGERAEMNFFNPLVMVDWVAINNPEKILAAAPANIARIEVVTVPYVKGNMTYGGIVSIISRRGDFAGIDLPASGIFFNYQFKGDTCKCTIPEKPFPGFPDPRNTIYWNPSLAMNAAHQSSFSFASPSIPGEYEILVSLINSGGETITQKTAFKVKIAD